MILIRQVILKICPNENIGAQQRCSPLCSDFRSLVEAGLNSFNALNDNLKLFVLMLEEQKYYVTKKSLICKKAKHHSICFTSELRPPVHEKHKHQLKHSVFSLWQESAW